jgi:hypothetical protein
MGHPTFVAGKASRSSLSQLAPRVGRISPSNSQEPKGGDHPPLCHPERTRISYLTALPAATYAALRKESRMTSTEATAFDRKSGGAEGPAVRPSLYRRLGAPVPRFPAEACGVDTLPAPFLDERRTRGPSSKAWQEIGVKPGFGLSGIPQDSTCCFIRWIRVDPGMGGTP